jgi:hypothetical protein
LSALLTLAFLASFAVQSAPLVIDNFQVAQGPLLVGPGGGNPLDASSGASGLTTDLIGGFRNLEVTRTNGSQFGIASVSGGEFTFGMLTDNGYSRIIWDGDLNSSLNYALASIDLTGGVGRSAFRVRARSDIAGSVHLTVFSSATDYSTITFSLPGTGIAAPYTEFMLSFASLVQGAPSVVTTDLGLGAATALADVTNITAITLFIDGTSLAGLDAQFQLLEVADVPEPATFALVGCMLAGLSVLRRQRVR